tara:strand:+ start:220 stop:1314 length:1095 start_codon:yes stop_codon:yes gene_type:complete
MANKKTTKKEEVAEATINVQSIVEPQVSMEDFTMIEKYQLGKNQNIAIRPYVTNAENMGLENYGLSLYDNVYHEEQLTCLDVNGVRRYLTGLNEFAPEVKRLDASKRKAKVKQIRTAVAELEKELAQNVVTVDDPEFWNKIKLLKPNNDEFWSKITLRVGNDPLYLDPKKDPYDLIKIFAIEAGGFSICAKDLETAKLKGAGCRFYLDNLTETVVTRTKSSKVRNKALAALQTLYDSNPTKLKYVAKVVDTESTLYINSTPNDVVYENMDSYIHGEGSERSRQKAAQTFLSTSNMSLEELKLAAILKDAKSYRFIADKSDGFIHTDNGIKLGRTMEEVLNFIASPLNDEVLMYIINKVEREWSI